MTRRKLGFLESKFPHDFDDESFTFTKLFEAWKYCENLEKWITSTCQRREIDSHDVVVESFKKYTLGKGHVVKTVFSHIQSESEMTMTDVTRDLLRCVCYGINYNYSELNDDMLKELGKRFE